MPAVLKIELTEDGLIVLEQDASGNIERMVIDPMQLRALVAMLQGADEQQRNDFVEFLGVAP